MNARIMPRIATLLLLAPLFAGGTAAALGATKEIDLRIKNQGFQPDMLTIRAGQRVKIIVKNEDTLPAEFESNDFNREKVIPGGTSLPVYVGPLSAGTYKFFNDFHPQSTGTLMVAEPSAPAASK